MFERLLIQNFQTHAKLRIDFDPGITTIVGPSDVGKSAIVRALRWVCTNNPGGEAFIRHGAAGATVRLVVDGHTITRRRGAGGVNEYRLDDVVYSAFGRGVPEAIEALVNMGDTGWQLQHDAPYWFTETAGEVSRQLNSIVDLSVIDNALASVGKALHRARTKLEVAEENLTTYKKEFDSLAWVPKFEADLCTVGALLNDFDYKQAVAGNAARRVADATKYRRAKENAADVAQAGQDVVDLGTRAYERRFSANILKGYVREAREAKAKTDTKIPCLAGVTRAFTRCVTAAGGYENILRLTEDVKMKKALLCKAEKELKAAEAAMPDKCPLCGQSWQATSTSKQNRR